MVWSQHFTYRNPSGKKLLDWGSGDQCLLLGGRDPGDEVVIHEPMGMGRDKYSTRLQDCHVDLLETAKYLRLCCTVRFVLCKCFVSLAIG